MTKSEKSEIRIKNVGCGNIHNKKIDLLFFGYVIFVIAFVSIFVYTLSTLYDIIILGVVSDPIYLIILLLFLAMLSFVGMWSTYLST